MAAQGSVKDSFTFVGGINTEGGFFVTPENTWKEGNNVVPTLDGSVERRNGLDYEENYSLYDSAITPDQRDSWAFTSGVWTTVGGNGNRDFFVVQSGRYLHFYNAATGVVSGNKKSFTVDLNTYKATGNPETIGTAICSFASTYGRLIVTSSITEPILIEYVEDTDTISITEIDLKIRDFKGKDTGKEISDEYTQAEWTAFGVSIDDVKYNLYNQGWTDDKINTYKSANSDKFPANTKQWIYGKDTNDDFNATFLNKQDFGNSPAPKGHFVIDAFSGTYRPRSCAFFAGRAWYGGVPNTEELGNIYFSSVLDNLNKIGEAYQTNDPTSEVFSDLEDDDGGVIQIPEAGDIVALQPLGRGLLVMASNGVWFISAIDTAFSAANYSVERITSIGCINANSIVYVEDALVYWSNSGIYSVQPGTTGAELSATNISDKNIKTLYNDIPVLNKIYAEGVYNSTQKVIYWLYSTTELTNSSAGRFNKNAVLALNVALQSWYTFTLDNTEGPIPVSLEVTKETSEVSTTYNVIVGSDTILADTDTVVANIQTVDASSKLFKVVTLHPTESGNYSLTYADFENRRTDDTKFKDWYSFDDAGVEKEAYMLTGYFMANNGPARQKTGQYLTVFMKRTETAFDVNANPINQSGCLMQSRYDFTDNSNPGKWAANVQVYKPPRLFLAAPSTDYDDGYPLVISKNKLRGRGKAVQFRYGSDTGKDMKLVGWTGTFVGNTHV